MAGRLTNIDERFWAKVNKTEGCWVWTGSQSRGNGGQYGSIRAPHHGPMIRAHRWAWENANGPLAPGVVLDHLCRNTLCVRPDHLEAVTHRENILRGVGMGSVHARKTHCVHGHALDGANLRMSKTSGQRLCRECRRRWSREGKQRLAAAKEVRA